MNIKKHIPNAITCGNLFCGCIALIYIHKADLVSASYFVGIGAILDFLDGLVARVLNVHSEIGKQLDSLADMITFGLVPGTIIYSMLLKQAAITNFPDWLPYVGYLVTIFSALRLAKFNIDTRQSDSFIGLPTPAATLLICSFPLILRFQPNLANINISESIGNVWFLVSLSVIVSFLLVAELPLFALKFKSFDWSNNKIRYSFLIISCILLILFKFIAIPFIIFLYIGLSVVTKQ